MKYPHIAGRIFNTPLLIHPQKLDAIIAGLGSRLLGATPLDTNAEADIDLATLDPRMFSTRRGERAKSRGYQVIDGVAVLNVSGALAHRSRMEGASDFILGYNDVSADVEDAMQNADAHAVLMVFDSPGGEVQGAFEFADRIKSLRGKKPIAAIADGLMASAAYLGGSAADQVAVTATGYAGSIGIVMRHVDFSRALANEGINVTHIFAGAHKVDGNQFAPLPDAVRAEFQTEINSLYDMFVQAVTAHRGMSAQAVRDTEAAVFRGAQAVAAGLADRVATTDQMIAELAALRSSNIHSLPSKKAGAPLNLSTGGIMKTTQELRTAHPDLCAQLEREAVAALTADTLLAANMSLHTAVVTVGAAAERTRILAIQAHGKRLPGHDALVASLIAEGKPAPDAAEAIIAAEGAKLDAAAAALAGSAPKPAPHAAAPDDQMADVAKDSTSRESLQSQWDANEKLRAEFGDRFESFCAYKQGSAYKPPEKAAA